MDEVFHVYSNGRVCQNLRPSIRIVFNILIMNNNNNRYKFGNIDKGRCPSTELGEYIISHAVLDDGLGRSTIHTLVTNESEVSCCRTTDVIKHMLPSTVKVKTVGVTSTLEHLDAFKLIALIQRLIPVAFRH